MNAIQMLKDTEESDSLIVTKETKKKNSFHWTPNDNM